MQSGPMKEKDLRKYHKCDNCGRKIGQTMLPILWRVSLVQHGLEAGAIQRQQGLAMMMGGNGLMANIMGPDEDMTQVINEAELMICQECFQGDSLNLLCAIERSREREEAAADV
jgi:hypothetical protein